ncbi:pentatricopeptide repeat-containing protein At2g20710, mitochondrial-like [Mercurialis annua]|uniref:pentatricopeptide repeat-containing protein At2g20710, mitochondrial-like n=1 Tax=Mercurialis annua TaxID=3986 RepID=UPI00215E7B98|nr:pentatricopeptide repeat-containing protein At2g20710, mitochondrial-like [Mercurialis annua]
MLKLFFLLLSAYLRENLPLAKKIKMMKRQIKLHFSINLISRSNPLPRFYFPSWNFSASLFFSTQIPKTHLKKSKLCRRIEAVIDPTASVISVLDDWVNEGNTVRKPLLRSIVDLMKDRNRFSHALQISNWMADRPYIKSTPDDVAIRLELISKVYGSAQAEKYIENLSDELKCSPVYCALLDAYVREKSVRNAEAIMQEMRENGMAKSAFPYNILINLYVQIGDSEKIETLITEMERNGVIQGASTLSNLMAAYVSVSNISGMERILNRIEEDPQLGHDWRVYSVAANGYLKVGLIDKALTMLRKMEDMMPLEKNTSAFDLLLSLYAKTGKKEEFYVAWKTYKPLVERKAESFMCMISSLSKLDDIRGAEEIFRGWESKCKIYDFRVLNTLLSAYCRKGLFKKAEAAVEKAMKDRTVCASTWNVLAMGYTEQNQMSKAVEMLKRSISVAEQDWRPDSATLTACLDYLEEQGDIEGKKGILKSLNTLEPVID